MKRELRRQLPPGPRAPAALQLLGTWTRPTATLRRMQRYGKRVTVQLPFQPPFVVLSDPADVKELFTAPPDAVHPGEGARILEPVVGRNSVILLDEQAHLSQRRLMLPAFHGERMKALRGVMTEQAEQEVESWPTETPFALHARLQKVTLEIILRAVFGLERGPALERASRSADRGAGVRREPDLGPAGACSACSAGPPPSAASKIASSVPTG